jgi:hypothetical protein
MSQMNPVHSQPMSVRSILILSAHLRLCLPSDLLRFFDRNFVCISHLPPACQWPAHLSPCEKGIKINPLGIWYDLPKGLWETYLHVSKGIWTRSGLQDRHDLPLHQCCAVFTLAFSIEICCFPGDWVWWSSLGLSARSNGWAVSKPTFRRPSLSSSSGY